MFICMNMVARGAVSVVETLGTVEFNALFHTAHGREVSDPALFFAGLGACVFSY